MGELIVPLVMCGGAGTRLWPLSREGRPKQFIGLLGETSTFQDTMLRVADRQRFFRPVVITGAAHRFMVLEQLAEINLEADILLEPARRDSGPAIAAGAAFARARDPRAVVLALAADHVVRDRDAFLQACDEAFLVAKDGHIVTFGVTPHQPSTSYGYIRAGSVVAGRVRKVEQFVEKPDEATAARYVDDGYLWNSGNFMFRADALLDEYRRVDAESVAAAARAVELARQDLAFLALDAGAFESAAMISIDYAVMEKTSRAAVIPVDCGWSDVGSWRAVWDLSPKDDDGNVVRGVAVFENTRNSIAVADSAMVALEGVEDLVVVATEDAVLVSKRNDSGGLKRLVARLKSSLPKVTDDHRKVWRPWGSYHSLDSGERHQVKSIVVKPGGRLSLQKHHHRSEHWSVVRGIAQVTINGTERLVHENESVYIPMGAVHRLENPGKIPLELIEVQTGSYLGEDDIIRLEDDYRRS